MDFDEQRAKRLLHDHGIRIPRGAEASTEEEAAAIATELSGGSVIKPLIAMGGRGKAGLIRFADGPEAAQAEARDLLSKEGIDRLRIEERINVARELYACVVTDRSRRCPTLVFSDEGGVEIESAPASSFVERPVDIRSGITLDTLNAFPEEIHDTFRSLYQCYRAVDAELVEVNPLAIDEAGEPIALDAKLSVDDAALSRHPELDLPRRSGTPLELRAHSYGLYYVELDGEVGVLANGAGLTMATLDAVRFHGGRPANFMEIGGDAYRKGRQALEIVLGNPNVRSLLVNLCGAYARTDVMVEGLLAGWAEIAPGVPVSFSIHGTGQREARQNVRDSLGVEPFDTMDDAIRDAIQHA